MSFHSNATECIRPCRLEMHSSGSWTHFFFFCTFSFLPLMKKKKRTFNTFLGLCHPVQILFFFVHISEMIRMLYNRKSYTTGKRAAKLDLKFYLRPHPSYIISSDKFWIINLNSFQAAKHFHEKHQENYVKGEKS